MFNRNILNWKKQICLFLSAQTISLFGSSLVQYAIVWYITLETKSGTMLMLSTICGFIPQMLISIMGGVWADKYDRKKIIMLADALIALATLIIAIAFLSGYRSIYLLFLALAVRSLGTGVQIPAINAFIPQIVPADKLMKINGINSSLSSLMMVLSPAVSGGILLFFSIEAIFFIDVITAIIGVGITSLIVVKRQRSLKKEVSKAWDDIKKGRDYIKSSKIIFPLFLFQIIIIVLVSPAAFLSALLITRTFGSEIWRLSLCEITFGAGAVLGGIIISLWGGFKNRIATTLFASFWYGIFMIALGMSDTFIIFIFFNILAGVTMPCYNTPINVFIQETVPEKMQGRIFGFMQISASCALPLGMVIFGPLADLYSLNNIFIYCGILVLLTTYVFWQRKRRFILTHNDSKL